MSYARLSITACFLLVSIGCGPSKEELKRAANEKAALVDLQDAATKQRDAINTMMAAMQQSQTAAENARQGAAAEKADIASLQTAAEAAQAAARKAEEAAIASQQRAGEQLREVVAAQEFAATRQAAADTAIKQAQREQSAAAELMSQGRARATRPRVLRRPVTGHPYYFQFSELCNVRVLADCLTLKGSKDSLTGELG